MFFLAITQPATLLSSLASILTAFQADIKIHDLDTMYSIPSDSIQIGNREIFTTPDNIMLTASAATEFCLQKRSFLYHIRPGDNLDNIIRFIRTPTFWVNIRYTDLWVDADYFIPVVVYGQESIDSSSLVSPIAKTAATAAPAAAGASGTTTPTGFTAEELEQKSVYVTKTAQGQWGYVLAANPNVVQRVLCARPLTFPRQSQHVDEIKGFRDYMQIDSGAQATRLIQLSMTTQKRLENLPVIDMPTNESIKAREDQWTDVRRQFMILRNSFNQVNLLFGRITSPEQLGILSLTYSICMRHVRQLEDRILKIMNNPRSFVDVLSYFNSDKLKNQIVPIKLFMRTEKKIGRAHV